MNPSTSGVVVEARDGIHQFPGVERSLLGAFKADERALEAAFLAGADLVGHIGLASTVVADKDGGQMRAPLSGGHAGLDFAGYLGFDVA